MRPGISSVNMPLRDQEKSLGELTASELEQTAVWDKHFMDEYVFDVQGSRLL